MTFMSEWQEQYLTIERSERVRYWSSSVTEHFPNISEDSQRLRGRPEDVSITQQRI